ncbi:DUF5602 domain-containing protein [Bdellovibrio bacteriovorus]|uniref:DUF5602 domain-containing protein n=1 Tax=Bdellovibrio bacteriovorus TaxID=959 RepID=UPI0021D300F2|nr:DUF5602 domain-containing protein [Bdellovibrio bacteriovorus]UXR64491.1 DUF5602 domain-containing protein [Bdellovibrio bacteriovorus]
MKWLSVGLLVFTLSSIAQAVTIWGPPTALGGASVRSFVEASDTGEPLAIGVAFPREALQGLSEHEPAEYAVALPTVVSLPPYNHIVLNWMPHGHEPDSIYGKPHFDFHFYLISPEQRLAISCLGEDEVVCMQMPAQNQQPPFYVGGPGGVPQMGWHWVDLRSPEYNGQPFTSTFIYGFYAGKMNFLEPMITRDFIQATTAFESPVPMAEAVAETGFYPAKYTLEYNEEMGLHMITMRDLTKKEAAKGQKPSGRNTRGEH